jgi:hypothetical protein
LLKAQSIARAEPFYLQRVLLSKTKRAHYRTQYSAREQQHLETTKMMDASFTDRSAARTTTWSAAGYDGRVHAGALLGAVIPALAILLVAAALLATIV